jgi:hypothetical protein
MEIDVYSTTWVIESLDALGDYRRVVIFIYIRRRIGIVTRYQESKRDEKHTKLQFRYIV